MAMSRKLEHELQHDCVIWFNQKYPEKKGLLFAVNNEAANGPKQAQQLKALGVHAGVSDLIYIDGGVIVGIELKLKGSRHKVDHVKQQIKWGEAIANSGGYYYICRSLEGFIDLINNKDNKDILSLQDCKQLIEDCSTKTIKF